MTQKPGCSTMVTCGNGERTISALKYRPCQGFESLNATKARYTVTASRRYSGFRWYDRPAYAEQK